RIELNDNPASPTTLLNNNGTLTAGYSGGIVFLPQPASRLHITATNGNARVDLDGSGGNGQVDVFSNATLDIDVAVNDGVDGTMNLSAGSTLDVQDAWSFGGAMNVNTPGVFIGFGGAAATIDGGTVTQYGGTIMLDTPNVDALRFAAPFIANGGAIVNHGRITFDADATINAGSDFQMNGEYASIIVGAGATVRIDDVNYNLDGDGTATNVATVGEGGRLDLNLGAGADVVMDNVINLNGGQLDVSTAGSSWTISRELNLANTGSNAPAVNGDAVSVGNDSSAILAVVKVGGTGISNLNAPVTFMSDTQVDIAAGATLRTSTATFESVNGVSNASFTGAGTWRMAGTNTFNEATTINMTGGTVDLDSSGDLLSLAANDTFVNAPLTLNVGTLASYGKTGIAIFPFPASRSDLNVDHNAGTGSLTVNLDDPNASWTLNGVGVLNLTNDNSAATLLAGNDLQAQGTINVVGDVRSDARIDLTGTLNIGTAGQPFRLSGGNASTNVNTIAGGSVIGAGILGADSGTALYGHGLIDTDVSFAGNAQLVARDGTLVVNGALTDYGRVGTSGAAAVLDVGTPWSVAAGQVVRLEEGKIIGSPINNSAGEIYGHGEVQARV
ncbi:MAG: hypothetical protein KDA44_23775, partial [Planctomycetales bacterium]|nr:hypothetical protein [Planctomycetales bacterium]